MQRTATFPINPRSEWLIDQASAQRFLREFGAPLLEKLSTLASPFAR